MDGHNLKAHPDFQKLLERYHIDPRFSGKEQERQKCIDYLLNLSDWVQRITKPLEITAVLLTGSFSCLKKDTPDLAPVIRGPWFRGCREGGSDLDVLFVYSSNISGLLKLRWLDFNIPERELVHPDDFVVNTIIFLKSQLNQNCSNEFINRVEIHVSVLTQTLGRFALKKYVRHMIQTGTLIWGILGQGDYGIYRDNPPTILRPTSDPIIDLMSGGF